MLQTQESKDLFKFNCRNGYLMRGRKWVWLTNEGEERGKVEGHDEESDMSEARAGLEVAEWRTQTLLPATAMDVHLWRTRKHCCIDAERGYLSRLGHTNLITSFWFPPMPVSGHMPVLCMKCIEPVVFHSCLHTHTHHCLYVNNVCEVDGNS